MRAAEFFARYAFPRGTVGTSRNLLKSKYDSNIELVESPE